MWRARREDGRYGAITEYEAVLQELQTRGDVDTTSHTPTLNNYVWLLLRAGQSHRALQVMDVLLARRQGPEGGTEREPAEVVNHVRALLELGRNAQALALADSLRATTPTQGNPRMQANVAVVAAEAHCAQALAGTCDELLNLAAAALLGDIAKEEYARDLLDPLTQARALRALGGGAPTKARELAEAALRLAPGPAPLRRLALHEEAPWTAQARLHLQQLK